MKGYQAICSDAPTYLRLRTCIFQKAHALLRRGATNMFVSGCRLTRERTRKPMHTTVGSNNRAARESLAGLVLSLYTPERDVVRLATNRGNSVCLGLLGQHDFVLRGAERIGFLSRSEDAFAGIQSAAGVSVDHIEVRTDRNNFRSGDASGEQCNNSENSDFHRPFVQRSCVGLQA